MGLRSERRGARVPPGSLRYVNAAGRDLAWSRYTFASPGSEAWRLWLDASGLIAPILLPLSAGSWLLTLSFSLPKLSDLPLWFDPPSKSSGTLTNTRRLVAESMLLTLWFDPAAKSSATATGLSGRAGGRVDEKTLRMASYLERIALGIESIYETI